MKRHRAVLAVVVLALAPAAPAQETPADEPPPSLDELLGLDEDADDAGAAEAARRDDERELQERLSEAEATDAFAQAVRAMAESAAALDERFDAGLGTQRLQEEIIRKLDQLIDFARQQQQQGRGRSSSGRPQQQQQQPPPQPRQQQQQQQQSSQRAQQPQDSQEGDPPPRQDGAINTVIDETRSEWGDLPPRVRQELLQGRGDRYSSLYEQMTREYYRRLAEEDTP